EGETPRRWLWFPVAAVDPLSVRVSPLPTPSLALFAANSCVKHMGSEAHSARRAEAAGPPDCWTGTTDEKLLRITEKQLNRIAEERNALAEKAFERATFFGMGLPGSPQDQKDSIYLIFKDEIDELDLSQRLKTVRKWNKESEVGSRRVASG
ncbi:hypothetical protein H5410_064702, partial [Solanum commersonii]